MEHESKIQFFTFYEKLQEAIKGEMWSRALLLTKELQRTNADLCSSYLTTDLLVQISENASMDNPLVDFRRSLKDVEDDQAPKDSSWDSLHFRNMKSMKSKEYTNPVELRKPNLLFVANGSAGFHFLNPYLKGDALKEKFNTKKLDTSPWMLAKGPTDLHGLPDDMKALFEWADIIFFEWLTGSTVWLINWVPHHKKVIARLHSYELTTSAPLKVDWGKIDSLICVSDHNLNRLEEVLNLKDYGCKAFVLPNLFEHSSFNTPKTSTAMRTLGLCGYGRMNKRPDLALDLLQLMLRRDPTWKMHFLGSEPDLAEEREYFESFFDNAKPFLQRGTLKITSWTDAPADWFKEVGVILSCSNREGTHESCREGIASGALAVVRKWPWSANYGGNSATFPDSFLWDTMEEAANYLSSFRSIEEMESRGLIEKQTFLQRENAVLLREKFVSIIQS
jgi:glycosyltransferase involved in cell wall biosynthesis